MRLFSSAFLLVFCIFQLTSCNNEDISLENKEQYLSSLETGNTIISALSSYKESVGVYPRELSQLVPLFMEEVPETELGNRFLYLNLLTVSGYDGADAYDLLFNPKPDSFFGGNSSSYFVYTTKKIISQSDRTEIHFVIGGWAYVTSHRNAIGEGGRIE